jgi:tetratricopeptide (TPR) repeat protein
MPDNLNISEQIAELATFAVGLFDGGKLDESKEILSTILQIDSENFVAIKYVGIIAASKGSYVEAIKYLTLCVQLRDDDAVVCNVLSVCHFEIGNYQQALDFADRAIALRRTYHEAHNNRGNALNGLGRSEEALAAFRTSLIINPNDPVVMINIGNSLRALDRCAEALGVLDAAISIDQTIPDAHYNRGNVLQDLGRHVEAIQSYDFALALAPNAPAYHLNRCYCNLLIGELKEGWREQEWRWLNPNAATPPRNFPMPLWMGQEDLRGKSILLHCEQGLGDCLQFVRYASVLAGRGATVLIEAYKPLVEIFQTVQGVVEIIPHGAPLPTTDYHCPLMSLPLALDEVSISESISTPYLSAPPAMIEAWRERLGSQGGVKIGLVCSGGLINKNDKNRSIPLEYIANVLPRGAEYFLIQKDLRGEDGLFLENRSDIKFVGDAIETFLDTAAICMSMDLVISVDTSVAHLSGALHRPTWILLPFDPDWRWGLKTEQTPWYPSAKLYRQPARKDWAGALKRVSEDLEKVLE